MVHLPPATKPTAAGLRPWLLPAPLLAAALIIGGIPGIILGWAALLLGIDRLLDRFSRGSAADDANRAFRRATRGRDSPLAYLDEDSLVATRRALGVQPIAIASIVGSVDRHKAEAFDRAFRPPPYSHGRWTLLYRAARSGTELPPIAVYRLGAEHYVRDGHHRISVARATEAADIEAEVVELLRA